MLGRIWLAIKIAVALLFGIIVFRCTQVMDRDVAPVAPPPAAAAPASPALVVVGTADGRSPPSMPSQAWEYDTRADPLTSKPTAYAGLRSVDQLSLERPYEGRNYGQLTVRQSPRHGLDAIFAIEQGQLICGYGAGDCGVQVAFDGKPPQRFSMSKPADSSSTSLFFDDAKRFIKQARSAREIRIAAIVYKGGEPTLTFRADAPLVWPQPAAK